MSGSEVLCATGLGGDSSQARSRRRLIAGGRQWPTGRWICARRAWWPRAGRGRRACAAVCTGRDLGGAGGTRGKSRQDVFISKSLLTWHCGTRTAIMYSRLRPGRMAHGRGVPLSTSPYRPMIKGFLPTCVSYLLYHITRARRCRSRYMRSWLFCRI